MAGMKAFSLDESAVHRQNLFASSRTPDYDLVVIGSGPAGQKGAINAAKLGKRVAVIERAGMVGGASVHSGTIPSKTLRDAILYVTGFNERAFYGQDYRLRNRINSEELAARV